MKYVYALVCPISKQISYVGISKHPERRLEEHLKDVTDTIKTRWLKALQELKQTPSMFILATIPEDANPLLEEARWILFGFSQGWPLKNSTVPDRDLFILPELSPHSGIANTFYKYRLPGQITHNFERKWWWPLSFKPDRSDALCVEFATEDDSVFEIYYQVREIIENKSGYIVTYDTPSLSLIFKDMRPGKRLKAPTIHRIRWRKLIKLHTFDGDEWED